MKSSCFHIFFTFHYVSINTEFDQKYDQLLNTLHSTMFLLILDSIKTGKHTIIHFTFHYVSINTKTVREETEAGQDFTFHYVSINTDIRHGAPGGKRSLHSTMFLLIRI